MESVVMRGLTCTCCCWTDGKIDMEQWNDHGTHETKHRLCQECQLRSVNGCGVVKASLLRHVLT